jgi:segregation and condensation protein B
MDKGQLRSIVEAMIFVSEEPITENTLFVALGEDGVDKDTLKDCIAAIEADFNGNPERGLKLSSVAGGYQFRTKEACAPWLKRLNVPKPMRLSAPALETLAIIAYKQPIVRSEIEKIRGVDTGGVLKTLLERRLLKIVGRRDEPGQPLLYGTTKEFLEIFNLSTLKELPTLRDVEDLLRQRKVKTDSPDPSQLGIAAECHDQSEPTEGAGEEEGIGVVECHRMEDDVESEEKDMEALGDLEHSLKTLRRLERDIFPRPIEGIDIEGMEGADAKDTFAQEGGGPSGGEAIVPSGEAGAPFDEAPGEDAAAADDRTGE